MAALPPLVDVDDVSMWPGVDVESLGDATVEAVLRSASALVRSHTGQTWVNSLGGLEDVPDAVRAVVIQVAARVLRNPSGITQEATGPFSVSYAGDGLFLSAVEKSMLGPYRSGRSGLWTQPLTRDGDVLLTDGQLVEDANPGSDPWLYLHADEAGL